MSHQFNTEVVKGSFKMGFPVVSLTNCFKPFLHTHFHTPLLTSHTGQQQLRASTRRVKKSKKSAWKSLEILTEGWHRKTSLLPSQEQDIPLGEDLESNSERSL